MDKQVGSGSSERVEVTFDLQSIIRKFEKATVFLHKECPRTIDAYVVCYLLVALFEERFGCVISAKEQLFLRSLFQDDDDESSSEHV